MTENRTSRRRPRQHKAVSHRPIVVPFRRGDPARSRVRSRPSRSSSDEAGDPGFGDGGSSSCRAIASTRSASSRARPSPRRRQPAASRFPATRPRRQPRRRRPPARCRRRPSAWPCRAPRRCRRRPRRWAAKPCAPEHLRRAADRLRRPAHHPGRARSDCCPSRTVERFQALHRAYRSGVRRSFATRKTAAARHLRGGVPGPDARDTATGHRGRRDTTGADAARPRRHHPRARVAHGAAAGLIESPRLVYTVVVSSPQAKSCGSSWTRSPAARSCATPEIHTQIGRRHRARRARRSEEAERPAAGKPVPGRRPASTAGAHDVRLPQQPVAHRSM